MGSDFLIGGDEIRRLRKEKKWNQQQLADAVGVAKTTIVDWEKGRYSPTGANIKKLAQALEVSILCIMGENESSPTGTSILISEKQGTAPIAQTQISTVGEEPAWIPIVEPHVCAGGGNGYCEIDWEPVGKYPIIPADMIGIAWHSGTLRIIRVDGSSMEPRYRDGDMVIFSEESITSGDNIIALWDGRLFLRGYIADKKSGYCRLKALNPDYADILIHPEDERFQPLGKVVGKVGRVEPDTGFW